MVDAVVSYVIENVGNVLSKESKLLFGVRDQVEAMQIELKWMHCFLMDAEKQKGESHRVRYWVEQIQTLAYDVEDVIEHFILKSALRNRAGIKNLVHRHSINRPTELHQTGSRIEEIKAKLSNLRKNLKTYGIREIKVGGEETAVTEGRKKRQDYVHIVDHNIIGLDEKITELILHLLDGKEASVVCVYGMGGLGKTTTAKQVYSDQKIKGHFERFAWVYVSQQFNPRQVWESILSQCLDKLSDQDKEDIRKMEEGELLSKLFSLQKEKKCLIVIDDIWQNQDWDDLSVAFPYMDTDSRSKILVTSRNEGVVSHGAYRTSLDILDEITSFMLLKNTILHLGGPNHPIREKSSMDKFAKGMVKHCAGLPLAIIVLGGILATKHELSEWERVSDNIKSVLKRGGRKESGHGVAKVLKSSYDDLPYYLKSCFLYFSLYPEDAEIKTTELKQKWIGEGFVSSSMKEGEDTMEDVAEDYLNELLSRCMVQAGRRGCIGRVKTCRMHDMMHDLCIEKAKEEGFAHSIKAEAENDLDKVSFRRLFIFFGRNKLGRSILPSSPAETFPQLRSIGFFGDIENIEAVRLIVKKLKFVRVLQFTRGNDSYRLGDTNLGERIGNLIHLRYLVIHPTVLRPIGNLRFLQTLNMKKFRHDFMTIPDSVWGMEQLRHLYLPVEARCERDKQQVCDFRHLQTFVNFCPWNFDLGQHLVKFARVRKLVLRDGGRIIEEALRQGIVFNRLQSLDCGSYNCKLDMEAIASAGLFNRLRKLVHHGPIEFSATCSSIWPINLTKLDLSRSNIDESHMGSLAKLENLKVLILFDAFTGKEFIFHRNDFPKLNHLKLGYLPNLETWVIHEGALPMLSSLQMSKLHSLRSIPEGTQFLKQLKLKDLQVTEMPDSFMESMKHWGRVSEVPPISSTNCNTEADGEKAEDGDEIQEGDAHVSWFRRYFFSLKSLSFLIITCLTFIFVLFQVY